MITHRIVPFALLAFGLAALATVAAASDHRPRRDDHRHRRAGAAADDAAGLALYRKECGACHVAFPPRLLGADAHRRILGGLDRHFGENAELDPGVRDRLEQFLVASAGEGPRDAIVAPSAGAGAPRITDGAWFRRKHRKIDPSVVARPSIRTFANCAACHAGAQGWDFEEDRVKIPAR